MFYKKNLHRYITFILTLVLVMLSFVSHSYASPEWPAEVSISADAGIVIDADTGTVLYGKNIHETYYPASITKILTALLIIENCDMDEIVTFSHRAVYDVESGSTSAGYDEGDTVTVRDALYALLLKSANEVANALAEHCAGSIEAFADMMNERAYELGCTDTHFANPSGLNNESHYTSAYDFALIARAAFDNPTFVEIDSTTYYTLPANSIEREPFTVYCGHKMLKKNNEYYYPGIIGGKTGYTTLAGNTLVTCARKNDMRLITIILHCNSTHYEDTKTLLDFGGTHFKKIYADTNDTRFDAEDAVILSNNSKSYLSPDTSVLITIPNDASFADVDSQITYELTGMDPDDAIARIDYTYNDRRVGSTYIRTTSEDSTSSDDTIDDIESTAADSSISPSDGTQEVSDDSLEHTDSAQSDGQSGEKSGEQIGGQLADSSDMQSTASDDISPTRSSDVANGQSANKASATNSSLPLEPIIIAVVIVFIAIILVRIHKSSEKNRIISREARHKMMLDAKFGESVLDDNKIIIEEL